MNNNEIIDVMKVCRLCLGTERLISVFDDRIDIPKNMIDVIQVTTGVLISRSDSVSQMLCYKCFNITIKMFKFRTSSIVNDMELKTKVKQHVEKILHKSVQQLLITYPKILLPSSLTKCNVSPLVQLDRSEVSNWFNEMKQLKLKCMLEANALEIPPRSHGPSVSLSHEISTEISERTNHPVDNNCNIEQSSSVEKVDPQKEKRKNCTVSEPSETKKRKIEEYNEDGGLEDSLVTVKYVTKSLFVCDICNSILYSAKDLKKHKTKHMKCKLCKKKFTTIEETQTHVEKNCVIKYIMNNLPVIKLVRCDEKPPAIQKEPSETQGEFSSEVQEPFEKKDKMNTSAPELQIQECFDSDDSTGGSLQIDLDEVDEGLNVKPTSIATNNVNSDVVLVISDDEDDSGKKEKNKSSIISSENNKSQSTAKHKKCNKRNSASTPKSTSPFTKPDLKIVGDNILNLNLDDNDTSLLKNSLLRTRENIKETGVQTVMPCNEDIVKSFSKDKLFELKNLRKFLRFYKIPVNLSYSSHYTVRLGNEASPFTKKKRTWSRVKTPSKDHVENNKLKNATEPITAAASQISIKPSTGNQKNESSTIFTNKLLTNERGIESSNCVTTTSATMNSIPAAAPVSSVLSKQSTSPFLIVSNAQQTSSMTTELSKIQTTNSKVDRCISSPVQTANILRFVSQPNIVSYSPSSASVVHPNFTIANGQKNVKVGSKTSRAQYTNGVNSVPNNCKKNPNVTMGTPSLGNNSNVIPNMMAILPKGGSYNPSVQSIEKKFPSIPNSSQSVNAMPSRRTVQSTEDNFPPIPNSSQSVNAMPSRGVNVKPSSTNNINIRSLIDNIVSHDNRHKVTPSRNTGTVGPQQCVTTYTTTNVTSSSASAFLQNRLLVCAPTNSSGSVCTIPPNTNSTQFISSNNSFEKTFNYFVPQHLGNRYSSMNGAMNTTTVNNTPALHNMPPPMNSFVPHRVSHGGSKGMSTTLQTHSGNEQITMQPHTTNNPRPFIRVKNVSELK